MRIRNIVIIGSGNLASNLGPALSAAGKKIVCVYSRNLENARTLASICKAKYTNQIKEIPRTADLYIIAINDSAIKEISEHLTGLKGIVVHTSGSVSISVFPESIKSHGVFYPLMTFSKHNKVSFADIPICMEANSGGVFAALHILANSISNNVIEISSEKRKMLHLAAVFACNFTNVNYSIAEDMLRQNGLSFDLLKPLIIETANNNLIGNPSENQTGPAFREDYIIMHQQMQQLKEMPEYKELYELMSKLIISNKHKND
jgi:predicted short-subunit dehydrogenase-like oxidoreductase (DUF2520 family)